MGRNSRVIIPLFCLLGVSGCRSNKLEGNNPSNLFETHSHPKLEVRSITVGMTHNDILAAANAAKMRVLAEGPTSLKLADPTASGNAVGGASGSGGSGLVLLIQFMNDRATTIMISEQGDMHGHVFEDLSKKWGTPEDLPSGYDSEDGSSRPATWGDRSTVYAEYHSSIYAFGGQNVTIYDAKALAPHPEERKSVPM